MNKKLYIKGMKVNRFILGATLIIAVASCGKKGGGFPGMGGDEAPQKYDMAVLKKENAVLETTYPVTIKGEQDIEIRPRIDGFIKDIYVDEGSVVRKGQSLFKIDSPMAEQAVSTAQAAVNSAQAQVNTAKINVDRLRPLAEKGIISKVQLDQAENGYQTALAGKAQAEASLTNARATLSWTNVTSPVNGVVGLIPLRQGSLVNPTNILTTVANTGNVFAYFSQNEKQLMEFLNSVEGKTQAEKIKNMPSVTLTLADGSEYTEKGKIHTISGLVNVATGSVNFRAEFPNEGGILRSGTSGKVTIPRIMNDVIIIPQEATMEQQNKRLVYKVEGDSVVQKLIEVVALPDGKRFAITNGMNEGETIIIKGIATLRNGKKILLNDASPKEKK